MPLSIGENEILVGLGEGPVTQRLDRSNRHGLVAGATGTGKTITLQVMAEAFSRAGVPVFCADIKGDLAGISQPGNAQSKVEKRAAGTVSRTSPMKAPPWCSGTCSASRAIRSAPPSRKWGRCCWRACSI
jgi:hypothetical protein